jgi:signal transduction histidine kinase
MGGYRKDLYLYDAETRQFTLNPNVTNSAIPSTQENFISRYTPTYLLQSRQQYADMVHGLNDKNQSEVDNYNNNLMRELTSYGKHYDAIVSDINNERLYQGRSDLLYYDVGKIFNENKIEFSALSDKLKDAPANIVSQDVASGRQLGEKVSIKEKYTLSDTQYRNVKLNIESKNITDPSEEQVNQAVSEVKSSPADTPPMAS